MIKGQHIPIPIQNLLVFTGRDHYFLQRGEPFSKALDTQFENKTTIVFRPTWHTWTSYCYPRHNRHIYTCTYTTNRSMAWQLPIIECLLHLFHITSCLFPIAYCLLPIVCCPLPLAACLLPIAWCLGPIMYYPLHIASCLLHIAYCTLPAAWYPRAATHWLLHIAHCPMSIAYYLLPAVCCLVLFCFTKH